MKWYDRKDGISVLVACQNEEAMLASCNFSFLDFADEIIVDNGYADRSKEIAQDLQRMYSRKIKYHDVPELADLNHNKQYALSKSSFDLAVREALILPQLTSLSVIKVALGS